MNKKDLELSIEKITAPLIESLGYDLIDLEYVKEDNEWYLRFYIDTDKGIGIDDCVTVSRALSEKLDDVDPIKDFYYLEVSSPGIDRPLKKEKDFVRFAGKKVKITFYKSFMEKKFIEGILFGYEEDNIIITVDKDNIAIDKNLVASVRLNDF
ncbi:MAG: ribosome maturation factor RimP [Clostridium sp.]